MKRRGRMLAPVAVILFTCSAVAALQEQRGTDPSLVTPANLVYTTPLAIEPSGDASPSMQDLLIQLIRAVSHGLPQAARLRRP